MQHPSVKRLFTEQAEYYAKKDTSSASSPIIDLILAQISKRRSKYPLKIGEFGGGAGLLLAEIEKRTKAKKELYNIELVRDYQKYQVSKKIKFVNNSVLDSQLPDGFFDIVIIRDVLHHLIGKDLTETRANQKRALAEIKRVLKPAGLLYIEELTNQSPFKIWMMYFLSRLNSKMSLRIRFLQISPHTIILFLTKKNLQTLVKKVFGLKSILKEIYLPRRHQWKSNLVHLGANHGKVVLIVKNPRV